MTAALSTHLDLLRLAAAAVVFLGHAGTQRISGGFLHHFAPYGEAAVDFFFVLSGFVIAHAAATQAARGPALPARAFAIARLARIASVALPALALGWLLDAAGPRLDPAPYLAAPNFTGPADAAQLASSLLFLDHAWWRAAQPGSNLPFWSLAFEAWYYLAFAMLAFMPKPWNWAAAGLVLTLAGPKIALLFPLWLLGAACYRVCARGGVAPWAGWLLLPAPVAAILLQPAFGARGCFPYMAFEPSWNCLAGFVLDYAVGAIAAAHLIGAHALSGRLAPVLRRIARPVRWLAGASFTLYLVHFPLIHFLAAASPWDTDHPGTRMLVFLGAPCLVLALAEVTERRRLAWRRGFAALLGDREAAR